MTSDKSHHFDASTLIELIRHGNNAAAASFNQYTLNLAFYEVGNSFRNDSALQQLVSREDATDTVDYLDSVREEMVVLSLSDIGATMIFDMASDERVTYYDVASSLLLGRRTHCL